MNPWPHQTRGVNAVLAAQARGVRRLVLASPTGAGKTRMMQMLSESYLQDNLDTVIYSNRKMLIDQLSDSFRAAGINHGVRAAGYEDERDYPLQISSIQTEHARRERWPLHPAARVLVDEGHLMNNPMARAILDRHYAAGASIVLVTATPLGLGDMADELIQAGTSSELRECGALVLARHIAPDEPDLKAYKLKLQEGQDLSENQQRKVMKPSRLFGRVLDYFDKCNPDRRPAILFAPGVPESLWYAQQLTAAGIRSAHIDGETVWLDGVEYRSSKFVREDVMDGSQSGKIVCLCNRFVLREGVDAPWLYHGIFATVFGSLQTYLQAGGRLLRAHPSLDEVVIQDHGGHWWRHGSLNSDRLWKLDDTNERLAAQRADRFREKREDEPFVCPKCQTVLRGRRCPCGFTVQARVRAVLEEDGTLREQVGTVYKARRTYKGLDGPKAWERMYWRSRTDKGRRTFRAAFALFAQEHNFGWPDRSWPYMPINDEDVYRDVANVPMDQLIQPER